MKAQQHGFIFFGYRSFSQIVHSSKKKTGGGHLSPPLLNFLAASISCCFLPRRALIQLHGVREFLRGHFSLSQKIEALMNMLEPLGGLGGDHVFDLAFLDQGGDDFVPGWVTI
jgi:hypothetical protein